jgi:hypothetical protein
VSTIEECYQEQNFYFSDEIIRRKVTSLKSAPDVSLSENIQFWDDNSFLNIQLNVLNDQAYDKL